MSKEDMFDSDNSDNKYYLITEKMQDDNGTSGSGSEICTTRNRSKRFNISSKYIDSDDELNIDEVIQAPIVNGRIHIKTIPLPNLKNSWAIDTKSRTLYFAEIFKRPIVTNILDASYK
uniref:Uncharacterized protein n=1 Tax=Vespula pensylvanica TaxID=30213 RepID=A0A834N4B7_VESPE|nr:hypothetical protein H0235_017069 [Vespula pensylvanica]